MSTELATYTPAPTDDYAIIERVAVLGDLSPLSPPERVRYYTALCRSLGLNPLTKPFEYLELDKRLVLYATRGATDQLRGAKGVSLRVVRRETDEALGVHIVEVEASTPDGRRDFASGVVSLEREGGEWRQNASGKSYFQKNGQWERMRGVELSNSLMKAETKAKRRATLSIVGLGWMDESEVGDVPRGRRVSVDVETGEVTGTREELVKELRQVAKTARELGLDPGLGRPAEMTDDDLRQAIATVEAMLASEYDAIDAPVAQPAEVA